MKHDFGKPSRSGYHNKEWAGLMHRVSLIPSDTGQLGSKEPGQQITHYIVPVGRFAVACATLTGQGFAVRCRAMGRRGQPEAVGQKRQQNPLFLFVL